MNNLANLVTSTVAKDLRSYTFPFPNPTQPAPDNLGPVHKIDQLSSRRSSSWSSAMDRDL